MSVSKEIEKSMRGYKSAKGESALKSLEDKEPSKQSSKQGKLREIRIQPAANGGYISHPDFEPPKSSKKGSSGAEVAQPYDPTKPNAHASLDDVHSYLDSHWGKSE